MKKIWTFLVVLIILILTLPIEAEAQSYPVISLEEKNIITPQTDVEFVTLGVNETIYALVVQRGRHLLFRSADQGSSWEKIQTTGLPNNEKFVALKTLTTEPVIVLTTTTSVYLSRNGGENFEFLGGPAKLKERGEEISSLAVAEEGDCPQILIGIWHPQAGKFAQEGVYLWGFEGKRLWEAQEMRLTWRERGYRADVTAVAFTSDPLAILAIATGDPDYDERLLEGTYLNIGYPRSGSERGAEWNWLSRDWPIEISENGGESPKEAEILSSQIVFPEDLDISETEESKFYILCQTRNKTKDGVYKVEDMEVNQLEIPSYPPIVNLDSLDYIGTFSDGALALGVTVKNRENQEQVQVYYLPPDEERSSSSDWSDKETRISRNKDCQVIFASDFLESGTIFAGTSGETSSFSRSKKNLLIPVSLIDALRGINQLVPSPDFSKERVLFLNYGNKNVLKLELNENYQLDHVENIFYLPQGFSSTQIRILLDSRQNLLVFETGKKRFWQSKDGGYRWSKERELKVEINDAKMAKDKIWFAGKDGMVYWQEDSRINQQGMAVGFSWLGQVAIGPDEKILVSGGTKEGIFDSIALAEEQDYENFPSFPVAMRYLPIVFSPTEESIYAGIEQQLYRLPLKEKSWEKMADLSGRITGMMIVPQGLYLFCRPRVYFSSLPLSEESPWQFLEVKGNWLGCKSTQLNEEKNLLFLWDSQKIIVYTHQIPPEEEEELPPEPTEPEPVEPQHPDVQPQPEEPVPEEPELVEPQPTEPEPASTAPPVNVLGEIGKWIAIVAGIGLLAFLIFAFLMR